MKHLTSKKIINVKSDVKGQGCGFACISICGEVCGFNCYGGCKAFCGGNVIL